MNNAQGAEGFFTDTQRRSGALGVRMTLQKAASGTAWFSNGRLPPLQLLSVVNRFGWNVFWPICLAPPSLLDTSSRYSPFDDDRHKAAACA